MNIQNMTVLTVEFTRIPLSRRPKSPITGNFVSAHITLRRVKLVQSHIKYTPPLRRTQPLRCQDEQ